METRDKLNSNAFRPLNNASCSVYDFSYLTGDRKPSLSSSTSSLNADGFRPITGRSNNHGSSLGPSAWQQYGVCQAVDNNSSLLMPAMPKCNAAIQRPDYLSKPSVMLDAYQQPFASSSSNCNQLTNTQLLNIFYYSQLQQQQQKQALLQQQLHYHQQQQRLLLEQKYSSMMAPRMSKSATMDNMATGMGPFNGYMLNPLGPNTGLSTTLSSNPAHQLTRSNTLFTMSTNHI